jgi:Holliday junction resolvase
MASEEDHGSGGGIVNQCRKGKRVEREAANFLTAHGIPTVRGARNGVKDGQDLMLPPEYDIHIEVKGDKSVRPGTKAMENALKQACEGAIKAGKSNYCVLWKEDRKGWRLTMPLVSGEGAIIEATTYREYDIVDTIRSKRGATGPYLRLTPA